MAEETKVIHFVIDSSKAIDGGRGAWPMVARQKLRCIP
jgi:hypothetical protein